MKTKSILFVILMFTVPWLAYAQYHIQFNSEADRVLHLGGNTLRGNWCTKPEAVAYYNSQSKFERDNSIIVGNDCPKNSSGAGGLSGVDISRFKPGQQVALMAAQSLLAGLLDIFGEDKTSGSAEDALKHQQAMLQKQEEVRQQALERWNILQEEEKKRLQAEQEDAQGKGEKLLAQMGGAGGQELGLKPISGEKLEFNDWAARKPEANPLPPGKYPAPKTALEQARCAAYFSERARELSGLGKNEEAKFMSQQAQKAMSGEPLDVPCQAATVGAKAGSGPDSQKAGSQDLALGINEILAQYNAKIKELLDISQKLAEVRKQKIEAEFGLKEADAKIMDIKNQAAAATKPEEKQKCDDLMNEALTLRGQSENLLKVAAENENACLASAREAESQVKELSSKLQEGKDKK
jgi:hypothetical protein